MSDENNGAAEAAEQEQAPARLKQNGETQPAAGTKTRRVWDIADEISASKERPALRDEVMSQCESEKINKGTAATQYGRWTRFHGLSRDDLNKIRSAEKEAAAEAAAEQESKEAA